MRVLVCVPTGISLMSCRIIRRMLYPNPRFCHLGDIDSCWSFCCSSALSSGWRILARWDMQRKKPCCRRLACRFTKQSRPLVGVGQIRKQRHEDILESARVQYSGHRLFLYVGNSIPQQRKGPTAGALSRQTWGRRILSRQDRRSSLARGPVRCAMRLASGRALSGPGRSWNQSGGACQRGWL